MGMDNIGDESKLLASLAVFRDIYDRHKDLYEVIAEFVKEIISTTGKHSFTATEMTCSVNNSFDFSLPEAVVNTAIKRLNLEKKSGYYIVPDPAQYESQQISELQGKTAGNNSGLIRRLISFIEDEGGAQVREEEKVKITRSFCSFLLDDSTVTEYTQYISGFAIKNNHDEVFRQNLKKIREGVILYSGIKFSNVGEIGSWKTPLTIFLDTEVLFDSFGYNGNLYKKLFEEFFELVKEINARAKKMLIRLEYFPEVKSEIDNFFENACQIIEGKVPLNPKSTAMTSIVEGCKTRSDVLSKKTEFLLSLNKKSIVENSDINYFSRDNHEFNIIDGETIKSISEELNIDIYENINFLNYINILRNRDANSDFEHISHILVTRNSLTIKLAFNEKFKQNGTVPLATSLNWITNRFWFKLNKGFGDGKFPISFDIISKAQIILSSDLNKSIGEVYDELLRKYKAGEITEEYVRAAIVELRSQVRKPEEIDFNDVSPILDALSENNLEVFIKEQELARDEFKKQSIENMRLQGDLQTSENEKKAFRIKLDQKQKEMCEIKKNLIRANKILIRDLENTKEHAERLVKQDLNFFKACLVIIALPFLAAPIAINIFCSVNIIDDLSWFLLIVPIVFYFISGHEWNWKPKVLLDKKESKYQSQRFSKMNVNLGELEKLKKDTNTLEEEVAKMLTSELDV